MSTSAIDICNLALTRLGHANIQAFPPGENSEEARKCSVLYDRIRRTALRAHPWNFATSSVLLGLLPEDTDLYDFDYAYQLPADCLRILHLVSASSPSDDTVPYEVRVGGVLLTDEPDAKLRYIKDVEDTTFFDEQFIEALSYRLAADLALPLTGKPDYAQSMHNLYAAAIRSATASDARERRREERIGKSFLDVRR